MARFALVVDYDPNGISTIVDTVQCWKASQLHQIEVLNFRGQKRGMRFPNNFPVSKYDGIIIHNTVSYDPENLWSLGKSFPGGLDKFSGRKILLKQDEHYKSALTDCAIVEFNFHVVFTLTNESNRKLIYPQSSKTGVQFVDWLTGYVSERMKSWPREPIHKRNLDIVYRGSMQPESFGRIADEKHIIANSALEGLARTNLNLDISARWADRIMGNDWYQFLSSSKAVLGVESGASIIDRYGQIWTVAAILRRVLPGENLRKLRLRLLAPFETSSAYTAIAPRHFEAIAIGTAQIMFPGEYSKVIVPNEHFIEVSRFNTDWRLIADTLRDTQKIQKIADQAFSDIITSGRYSYESFISSAELLI